MIAVTANPTLDTHLYRSPLLGSARMVRVKAGEIRVFERGSGPVVVFAHGWLGNANLWRKVVDKLAAGHRCIVLDLPLGSPALAAPAAAMANVLGGDDADVYDRYIHVMAADPAVKVHMYGKQVRPGRMHEVVAVEGPRGEGAIHHREPGLVKFREVSK